MENISNHALLAKLVSVGGEKTLNVRKICLEKMGQSAILSILFF